MLDTLLPSMFIGISGLAIVLIVGRRSEATVPSLVAYVLSICISTVRYSLFGLSSRDAAYYDQLAIDIATHSSAIRVSAGKEGLSELLAIVYGIFGHHPLYGMWINSIAIGVLTSVMAATAGRLDLPRTPTAWIAAIFPGFLFWGTLLLREPIVWLMIAIMAFAAAGLLSGSATAPRVSLLLASFLCLLAFRGSVAILVTAAMIGALAIARHNRTVFIVAALALLVPLSPVGNRMSLILDRYSLNGVDATREALTRTANSGFATGSSLFSTIPKVLPRVLFGPFPWEIGNVGLAGVADGLLWSALTILTIIGWIRFSPKRSLLPLALPAITLLLVLAATSGNYGTMIRLREQAAVLLIPMTVAALARIRHTPQSRSPNGTGKPIPVHRTRPQSKQPEASTNAN